MLSGNSLHSLAYRWVGVGGLGANAMTEDEFNRKMKVKKREKVSMIFFKSFTKLNFIPKRLI